MMTETKNEYPRLAERWLLQIDNALLGYEGEIPVEDLRELLKQSFEDWKAQEKHLINNAEFCEQMLEQCCGEFEDLEKEAKYLKWLSIVFGLAILIVLSWV